MPAKQVELPVINNLTSQKKHYHFIIIDISKMI